MVISHNMADVFEVADRVIVMRLGQRVAAFNIKETNSNQVIAAITGAEFGDNAKANSAIGNRAPGGNGQ